MELDQKALIETFLAESEENCAAMEEGLLALEARPDDPELLHTIFRAAHTVKGNAASFGLAATAELAHNVEDLLDRLREGTLLPERALVTLLLEAADTLRRTLPSQLTAGQQTTPVDRGLLKRLKRAAKSASRSRGEKTAPPVPAPTPVAERRQSAGRRLSDVMGADYTARTLRVGIEKLDRLLNLSGELTIARGRLQAILETSASRELRQALEVHHEADRLFADLQELVMEVRMVSVGPVFRACTRTVRDQAGSLGKRARLLLEGEDVEVDTKIIEHIHEPLIHMIRNALDHGIEAPAEREAKGKDPCGSITLRARHETGSVVFEVVDDGAGLDRERILGRARQRGLLGAQESLDDDEVLRLVLRPGFSTSENVTDLSGRGVGLDVVQRHVDALRGALTIDSRPGEGTTITARVPLTLAIIPGFGVGTADETFVVPLDSVVETLALRREEAGRNRGDGKGVINLRGEPLPYVRLRSLFGLGDGAPQREQVLVVRHEGGRAGLVVDVLYGESQTVIKPLGRLFQGLPGIAGSAILGSGKVALILDVPALFREAAGDPPSFEAQAQSLQPRAGRTRNESSSPPCRI